MRILIDARLYGLENAGLGRYTLNLVNHLSRIDKTNEYVLILREKYFNLLNFPPNWTKVIGEYRHYSLIEQINLPLTIIKYKPDLVHFPHFNVPLICPAKFMVTIHDLLMHANRGLEATTLNPVKYFLKRVGYWLVFKKAVSASVAIIVPSQAVKKDLLKSYRIESDKIHVTYEGADSTINDKADWDIIRKKYDISHPYFIYAGNAYPHKNIERAIKALKGLNKDNTKSLFLISSSRNIFIERLKEMIKREKAEKWVRLLGFVPDEELGVLYKKAAAFLYPSVSEGFGLQGLEVMNVGGIMTASDIPVFKEIYKDNFVKFDPYDILSIEDALKSSLELNKNKREEMIKRGFDIVKEYSWEKMTKETLNIYESSTGL